MRLLLALIVIWAEPLHVHGLGEAEARYQQGDFLVAGDLGRILASTDGDTLAAGRRWWKRPSARRRRTRAVCSS